MTRFFAAIQKCSPAIQHSFVDAKAATRAKEAIGAIHQITSVRNLATTADFDLSSFEKTKTESSW